MLTLSKLERQLTAGALILVMIGIFGPFVAQPVHQHDFADQRSWGGMAFAMNVLSNLAFALWGLTGLACLCSLTKRSWRNRQSGLLALFFVGLVVTAVASSLYHLQPNDAGLAIDRLGMVIAFAGLLGLAAAGRVSDRAGIAVAGAVLVLGPLSVWWAFASTQALAWLLIQFGGMAMILWLASWPPLTGALAVRWYLVVGLYTAAKLLELADHSIYVWTAYAVSGHTLKHVVASLAAWPVVWALLRSQNPCRIYTSHSDGRPAH